ncbi:SDR family oxidoreductase [Nonomuraea sp. NPDC048882]|uniref:SDR family oxidoreductase n=1 Tax=Nonomuraea sp. NPDC048882 TaxID=3154347 RepID=UPI003404C40D
MRIRNSVALVTGANRGLGRHLAAQLVERGAAKVYAAARDTATIDLPGVVPLRLDITDPDDVARAAEVAGDVTLLVNNAGIGARESLLTGDMARIRAFMDTNYYGTLNMLRAFAPILTRNGAAADGAGVLNVLSTASWLHLAAQGGYSASKTAGLALTDAVREELRPDGVLVTGLFVAFMDTDMAARVPADAKIDPAIVATRALDGVESGHEEVLADPQTAAVKATLSTPGPVPVPVLP